MEGEVLRAHSLSDGFAADPEWGWAGTPQCLALMNYIYGIERGSYKAIPGALFDLGAIRVGVARGLIECEEDNLGELKQIRLTVKGLGALEEYRSWKRRASHGAEGHVLDRLSRLLAAIHPQVCLLELHENRIRAVDSGSRSALVENLKQAREVACGSNVHLFLTYVERAIEVEERLIKFIDSLLNVILHETVPLDARVEWLEHAWLASMIGCAVRMPSGSGVGSRAKPRSSIDASRPQGIAQPQIEVTAVEGRRPGNPALDLRRLDGNPTTDRARIAGPSLTRLFRVVEALSNARSPGEFVSWADIRKAFVEQGEWKGHLVREETLRTYAIRIKERLNSGHLAGFWKHTSEGARWM
jgi:hypothetical protein